MTAKVRIELNHEGIGGLLKSAPVGRECEKAADRLAQAAGPGFRATKAKELGFGGGRVGAGVFTATDAARKKNAEEDTLLKAVSSCRS